MTDRHTAYIVTLENPTREDDAEETVLTALRQIRGVAAVSPVISSAFIEKAAETRRDLAWTAALAELANHGPGA